MLRQWMAALGLGLGLLAGGIRAAEWSQFRGPNGTGGSEEKQLASTWDAKKDVRWKVEVPGFGWSSPVVWGDKVFVTTAVSDKQTKPKPGSFGFGGMGGGFPPGGPGGGPGSGRRFGPPGG